MKCKYRKDGQCAIGGECLYTEQEINDWDLYGIVCEDFRESEELEDTHKQREG